MTIIDDKIRDEKLQYNINRESAKISALSSGKTDIYEYLIDEEILSFNKEKNNRTSEVCIFRLGKGFDDKQKQLKFKEKINKSI